VGKPRARKWEKADRERHRDARRFIDLIREVFRLEPLYGAKNMTRGNRKYGVAKRFVQDSVQL
jgi:hypothetical protein